ncbi:hypothetical protein CLU79DRAFT_835957 [Phycomyces nitens]|nr:hypothetical protein CLU79DRAFT_835957 [Phycomyces nitens]
MAWLILAAAISIARILVDWILESILIILYGPERQACSGNWLTIVVSAQTGFLNQLGFRRVNPQTHKGPRKKNQTRPKARKSQSGKQIHPVQIRMTGGCQMDRHPCSLILSYVGASLNRTRPSQCFGYTKPRTLADQTPVTSSIDYRDQRPREP